MKSKAEAAGFWRRHFSMDEAMIRRYLIWQHRWTGLLMTGVLIVVGLTGSLLAFRLQIDRLLNPELHVANPPKRAPLDLATLAERAEAAYPLLRAGYFSIEEDHAVMMIGPKIDPATGKPYNLGFDELILDPWTGNVLGRGMEYEWTGPGAWRRKFLPFVYSLHTSLAMSGGIGWRIVSVVALAWTLDCFAGFYLTLPRGTNRFWQRWIPAWKIKFSANATRINFDMHRAGGLWLWPLLFVFGWSSVMLELRQVYEPVMKTLFDYVSDEDFIAKNSVPKRLDNPQITWRQAEEAGERAMTEQAALHHFTVERPYGMAYISDYGAYTYCVRSSLDFRGHGWDTSVLIDGNTGQFRSVDLPRGQHLGNTISTLLWGIHYGDLRNFLPFRLLVFVFGFFLSALSITGVVIWWKKRAGRKLAVSRQRSASGKEVSSTIPALSGAKLR
jgi:uncharacterized iron-regulated membrane protein